MCAACVASPLFRSFRARCSALDQVSLVGLVIALVEVGKNLVGFRQDGVPIFQDRYIVLPDTS